MGSDKQEKAQLPRDVSNYIWHAASRLRDRAHAVQQEGDAIARDFKMLQHLCQEYRIDSRGVKLDLHDPVMGDKAQIAQAVCDLQLGGDAVPFFCEGRLYDLLGKEDARTVLAVVRRAVKALNPVASL